MIRELEKARRLRRRIRSGTAAWGAQLTLSDPTVAEIFGRAGFDWLVIDTEHAAHGPTTVKAMLQAGLSSEAVVITRVLRLDPDEIRRYLDLGSPGVMCPFIETREQAELLVSACRYPPVGVRGYGPRRANGYGFDAAEYFEQANGAIICIAMIESQLGVENAADIVSVDGIDGVCVGPMDLSIDLGVYQQFDDELYVRAVDHVRAACKAERKAMGTGCYSLEHARACKEAGDTLLLVGNDDGALQQGAAAILEELE